MTFLSQLFCGPVRRQRARQFYRLGRQHLRELRFETLEQRLALSIDLGSPVIFEPNVGQADASVDFLSRGLGYSLLLSSNEAVLALASASNDIGSADVPEVHFQTISMSVVGADPDAAGTAHDPLASYSNYFVGADASGWRPGVEHYGSVRYDDVYAGIDLVYYGTAAGELEYDFVVEPGANPDAIVLDFSGAKSLELSPDGSLLLTTGDGTITIDAPISYQTSADGRIPIASTFVIRADGRVEFEVGDYDPTVELVIDPVITYSTFLGGTGSDLFADVAVDETGAAYVVGRTIAPDFPLVGAIQGDSEGHDVVVVKFAPDGQSLLYSTYLGGGNTGEAGANDDIGRAIDVDALGRAHITGQTESSDFPITTGALQATDPNGGNENYEAFVARLSADGSQLEYSTYLGGTSGGDTGNSIVVDDATGNYYVTGRSNSQGDSDLTNGVSNFPLLNPITSPDFGSLKAFVTVFAGGSDALLLSTFVGGAEEDEALGIALDSQNNIIIAGRTQSFDLPNAVNAPTIADETLVVFAQDSSANGAFVETERLPVGAPDFNDSFRTDDIIIADINGDSLLDFVGIDQGARGINDVAIHYRTGADTFGLPQLLSTGETNVVSLVSGDFDKNGLSDLAVLSGFGITVFAQTEAGVFSRTGFLIPVLLGGELIVVDLDDDTNLDLVASGEFGGQVSILWGDGTGAFSHHVEVNGIQTTDLDLKLSSATPFAGITSNRPQPKGIAAGDLNGDGAKDLLVALRSQDVGLILYQDPTNNRNFNTSESQVIANLPISGVGALTGAVIADFDNNNSLDFALGSFSSETGLRVYIVDPNTLVTQDGTTDIGFSSETSYLFDGFDSRIRVADINGDGNIDIVGSQTRSIAVFINNPIAPGLFYEGQTKRTGNETLTVAVGDVTGDGVADVVAGVESVAEDAFIAKISDPFGSPALSTAYFGGSDFDQAYDLAISSAGQIVVVGRTDSNDLPTTADAFQQSDPDASRKGHPPWDQPDGFYAVFAPDLSLSYASYLGSIAGKGFAHAVAIDEFDRAVVVGGTEGQSFPIVDALIGQDRLQRGLNVLLQESAGNDALLLQPAIPVDKQASGVAAGDFNHDGLVDLVTSSSFGGSLSVVFQDAASPGTYLPPVFLATGYLPQRVVAGDFDGDGRDDLASLNSGHSELTVWIQDAANPGEFVAPRMFGTGGPEPEHVAVADVDNDGDLDLIVSHVNSGQVSVLKNDGGGRFGSIVAGHLPLSSGGFPQVGEGVIVGQFDTVAGLDLAIVTRQTHGSGGELVILGQTAGGGFLATQSFPIASAGRDIDAADLDNNGLTDIVAGSDDGIEVLLQTSPGIYAATAFYDSLFRASAFALGDVTGDGLPDLIDNGSWLNGVAVRNGNGDGTFGPLRGFSQGIDLGDDVIVVDLNGDSLLDIAATERISAFERGFVTRFDANGDVDFSTFLGTSSHAFGVSVNANSTIFVVGNTRASNFPTVNPFQASMVAGGTDAVLVRIEQPLELGDAPDSYQTSVAAGGPRHLGVGVRLGALRDLELDAPAILDGTSDDVADSDDEDGIQFSTLAVEGHALVTATIANSNNARLYGWIDFNADGDFDDAGEQIADGTGAFESLSNGAVAVRFTVPGTASVGNTYARFRVSAVAGLGFSGPAPDGEVEDYAVEILHTSPAMNPSGRYNVNNAGDVDVSDLLTFVSVIRAGGFYDIPPNQPPSSVYPDIDGNYSVDIHDLMSLLIFIRSGGTGEGEAIRVTTQPLPSPQILPKTNDPRAGAHLAALQLYNDSIFGSNLRSSAGRETSFDIGNSPNFQQSPPDRSVKRATAAELDAALEAIAPGVSEQWQSEHAIDLEWNGVVEDLIRRNGLDVL